MAGEGRESKKDNDLFYTCSLIDYIARKTENTKKEVVNKLEKQREHMDYIYRYKSPLGNITLASDGTYLTGLWFDGQKYDRSGIAEKYEEKDLKIFKITTHWLDIYFSGKEPDFTPPIRMCTTDFRKDVWEILLTIPYGKTMTYGEIAAKIAGQRGLVRMSAQAVGGAVGHNAISVIIPCHRVVGSDGSLTGYAGGIERKKKLLLLEKAELKCPASILNDE